MITVIHPSETEILHMLSDQHRRQVVRHLRKTPDGDVEFDQLCDHLFRETPESNPNGDDIAIKLHHHHLPKLHERGLIDYDPNEHRVRYHPNQQVEDILDGISPEQMPRISDK